ncbi:MAG: glycoside hydrolase family 16 protein [Chitinophagaceae bacterium]|nr:glycoside hydrolase family 16 protein [Chitinophagaceae bacterium]MCW5927284.1 glycoside hydrolase family 16 protein [Chitinophagaceae bacterium]
MRKISLLIMAAGFITLAGCSSKNGSENKERKLVWSDEFDYSGLPDSNKWGYDTGGHGWGNNEKQFYTEKRAENAVVGNGVLSITAIKEAFEGAAYTSARLVSKHKGDWKYGRFEIKAKLPAGRGIWPAIWMLPTDPQLGDWPESGEIDIMEFVGYQPDSVFGTVHTGAYNHTIGTQKGKSTFRGDLSDTFHVYILDWDENEIKIFVDDELYFSYPNEKKSYQEWPFDQHFHLLLNVAVGGNWGGSRGIDESIFPQTMQIDYVRVYQ